MPPDRLLGGWSADPRQADHIEQAQGLAPLFLCQSTRPNPRRVDDIFEYGQPRQERGLLKDHADTIEPGADPVSADADIASRGCIQAGNQAQKGGLAATRRPQQTHEIALIDRQVDVVEGHERIRGPRFEFLRNLGYNYMRLVVARCHPVNPESLKVARVI